MHTPVLYGNFKNSLYLELHLLCGEVTAFWQPCNSHIHLGVTVHAAPHSSCQDTSNNNPAQICTVQELRWGLLQQICDFGSNQHVEINKHKYIIKLTGGIYVCKMEIHNTTLNIFRHDF